METNNYTDTKEYKLAEQLIKEREEHEVETNKIGGWIIATVAIFFFAGTSHRVIPPIFFYVVLGFFVCRLIYDGIFLDVKKGTPTLDQWNRIAGYLLLGGLLWNFFSGLG